MARDGGAGVTEPAESSPAGPPAGAAPRATLAQRIMRETARFAAVQAVASVIAWTVNLLLARILAERDFGVYSICTFWIGIGAVLGDGGLGAALLRRRGEVTREEYRATLTALLGVSTVLATALLVAAPYIGHYDRMTAAETRVLRVMALLYFVNAFRIVPYIRLERELQFGRIARIELTASLVRHALAIGVALARGGVWALAVSNLVGSTLQLALAYRASPGWVGLGFSWRVFRPLISFGGQIQILNVCAYLKDRISPTLLGFALGPRAVGVFDFGMGVIQWPVIAVNSLARVQLPVYARLEARDPTLYAALRGAMRVAMLLGVPLLCASALASPWLVPALFSSKWAAAYPVIWGLLANMIGGLVASPLFTLVQGQGRAALAIRIFVTWTLATWTLAIAAVRWFPGDLGMVALAHSVVTVAVVLWLIRWAGRHLGRGLFSSVAAPAVAGALGLAAGFALARAGRGWQSHPIAAALVSVLVYFGVMLALERGVVVDELRALIAGVRKREPAAGAPPPSPPPSSDVDRAA